MRHCGKYLLAVLLLPAAAALAQVTGPVITTLNPTSVIAGSLDTKVNITGANFVAASQVRVNGLNRPTQFVDSRHLNVTLFAADLTQPRTFNITVVNPGVPASAAVTFEVVSNIPIITSINPTLVPVGSNSFLLTVNGSGFAPDISTIRLENRDLTTTFVNQNQLTATIAASELTIPRKLNITVFNEPPINTTSNSVQITVSNSIAPAITLIDPNTVLVNSPTFTLTVIGTNFTSNSIIKINGGIVRTTFVDAQHLTTPIQDFQLLTPRTFTITVTNQTNNLTSNSVTLSVTRGLAPVIDSITPNSVQVGSGAFTLAVTGNNFNGFSIVRLDGDNRQTTFIDTRHLTATINRSDLLTEGQRQITVFTPPPDGGTSDPVPLIVFSQFAPLVTFLDPPNFATASPTLKLTVRGSRFALTDEDVVLVDGTPRVTEFVDTTTLVATLLPADVAKAGVHTVTVRNKNNFTSAPLTFSVSDQAGPVITTLSPATGAVGATPSTLTINGMNFTDQSIVTFDTVPRATTFVSTTQLTVALTAADLASARDIAIAILNPDGTASQPVRFTVALVGPSISSVSPAQVIAGDTGGTLTIKGSGFDANSIVRLNGTTRTAVFDATAGTLAVELTPADITTPGSITVTVTSSSGTSPAATLPVVAPRITSVTPSSIAGGTDNVTVTVTGTGFLPTSRIVFLGVARETTFDPVTGTLTTILRGTDLNISGDAAILVQNSPSAISAPFVINVTSPGAPRIDQLQPASIIVGTSTANLSVTGVNFLPGAVVRVNGSPRATIFVSSTLLTATLTAADLANTGTLTVTVVNPDGSSSTSSTITITTRTTRRRSVRR